jgi:NAD+ synthase
MAVPEGLVSAISGWIASRVAGAGAGGVVLGLSGGIDSAVCAGLAARALGPGGVLALAMPIGNSGADLEDARRAAEQFAVELRVVDLSRCYMEAAEACGITDHRSLSAANMKPRLRMTALYAHSWGRLVLGTGNYSEYLMGYSTKWGDSAADIFPLLRLFKDEVLEVGRLLGLPGDLVERIPSAGLWEGQSDEGEMGVTYDEIRAYFEGRLVGPQSAERIRTMSCRSAHKRDPAPFFDAREWIGTCQAKPC